MVLSITDEMYDSLVAGFPDDSAEARGYYYAIWDVFGVFVAKEIRTKAYALQEQDEKVETYV